MMMVNIDDRFWPPLSVTGGFAAQTQDIVLLFVIICWLGVDFFQLAADF